MLPYARAQVQRLVPAPHGDARLRTYTGYVDALCSSAGLAILLKYEIARALAFCHFMAQVAHETGGFTILAESADYSAARILEVFGVGHHSARVTQAEAARLAHNGEALFERVYGLGNPHKAKELGNTEPGDGYKFRGRGPMQTTGRADYRALGLKIGVDLEANPERLEEPLIGFEAAAWEWKAKGCNRWALEDNCAMITRKINGGTMGLDEREAYARKAKAIWVGVMPDDFSDAANDNAAPPAAVPPPATAFETTTTTDVTMVAATDSAPDITTLAPGAHGPTVEILQTHLKRLGYYPYPTDGDFGDRTIEALLAFKHANALPLSDKVDAQTWAALPNGRARDLGDRANITVEDLREKGSTEITDSDFHVMVAKLFAGIFGISAAGSQTGVADKVKAANDNLGVLKSIMAQLGDVMTFIDQHLMSVGLFGVLGLLFLYAKTNEARRVSLAQKGLHLGSNP